MTTKQKVIQILEKNINKAVSGEILALECNVSRAAIWKAVNSLRETGYEINATTNGGYIFNGNKDIFSKENFCKFFEKEFPEIKSEIEVFETIDSTNTYAKKLITNEGSLKNTDGSLTKNACKLQNKIIIAESQTHGKGRLGRTFYSPSKTGIYISIIIIPNTALEDPAFLTTSAAVAVCRTLKKLYKIDAKIKWINDIFVGGKKICGILTEGFANFESRTIDSAVIGIGINVKENKETPEELKQIATSISEQCNNAKINRAELAAHICGETLKILCEDNNKVIDEYKTLSFLIGKQVTVFPIIGDEKSSYNAKVIDIDDKAGLVVKKDNDTIVTLNSGEVSIKSENVANKL